MISTRRTSPVVPSRPLGPITSCCCCPSASRPGSDDSCEPLSRIPTGAARRAARRFALGLNSGNALRRSRVESDGDTAETGDMRSGASDSRIRAAEKRSPVVPPPQPRGLTSVLERNIRSLKERRMREERQAGAQERVADAITRFAGSMVFVYLHLVAFGFWIGVNAGLIPGVPRWDESFVVLGTTASVEAIFLSTFVLISQNRMAAVADKRADLDLQISLLAEHEVTKLTAMVAAITERLGIETEADPEVEE